MNETLLEIGCYNLQSVMNANKYGADRIELCSGQAEGGLTPSAGFIQLAVRHSKIPVYVMIRPRAGDFLYSEEEFQLMQNEMLIAKSYGASGFVFGNLNADGTPDIDKVTKLVETAFPLPCTFHRAIDMSCNPVSTLQLLNTTGISFVLTSGGKPSAIEGIETIRQMIQASGNRIKVMAGAGINPENLKVLFQNGVRYFHASATEKIKSRMTFYNHNLNMGNQPLNNEYLTTIASPVIISELKKTLLKLSEI